MGQYWKIGNIDKGQNTGHLGKMAEFFFSNKPHKVLYLLAVPTVPLEDASMNEQAKEYPAGSWAGDRIICLGDYSTSWPTGVVTAEDFTRLGATEDKAGTPKCFMKMCSTIGEVTFGTNKKAAYPEDRVWVLRNLSKKLSVRSNGIPTTSETSRGKLEYGYCGLDAFPGLANVLLSRIGCSDDPSSSMCYDGGLTSGEWAGDRFEARIFDEVEEEMGREGWKDVSRREAKRLHAIWLEDGEGRGSLPDEPEDN